MYQDAEHTWVSEAKRERHEKMKQSREDRRAKLIEEAVEGTSIESIEVSMNDEIAIMAKDCGRKGGKVQGVGSFPRLDIRSTSSSMPINSKWNEMKGTIQKLSSTVTTLESENAELKSMLRAVFRKLNGSNNINDDVVTQADDIEGRDDFSDGINDL